MGCNATLDGKLMFPSEYIAAFDLQGRDVTVEIDHAQFADLQMVGGKKERKTLLFFKGAGKKMVLNKTNGKIIVKLHGPNGNKWGGKRITLYPTRCDAFGEQVDCIRVRAVLPAEVVSQPNPELTEVTS